MEFLKNLLWVYPATFMTLWTALTLCVAWTARRNRPLWHVFSMHPMMMQLNPKDNYLYNRPSLLMALVYLALSITPVLSLVILLFVLWIVGSVQYDKLKKAVRKRANHQSTT